jgi:hypothetical protein
MKPQPELPDAPMGLTLSMSGSAVSRFFPILGEGILVRGPGGESVEGFLQKAAGVSPAYLKDRVQTVFLNGRALDDCSTAVVGNGATLALSAAMPGLAGAVLRRGGFYAAMRRQISHEAGAAAAAGAQITVTLKLFNLVARDLGPALLGSGIRIPGSQLRDFIVRQGRWIWTGCVAGKLDGRPIGVEEVAGLLRPDREVVLTVTSA